MRIGHRSITRPSVLLAGLVLTSALLACACVDSYKVTTAVEDQGVEAKVTIVAEEISDITRSGFTTSRTYAIIIAFPGRPRTVFTIWNQKDKELLSEDEMKKSLPSLAMKVSPNKRHFALSIKPYAEHVIFFHLLPKGKPLHVTAFDDQLKVEDLAKVDWSKMPEPAQLVRDSMLAGLAAKGSGDFCILGDVYSSLNLEMVVSANLDLPIIADTVLELWPRCRETKNMVNILVSNKAAPQEWLARLRQKIDQQLTGPKVPEQDLVRIFSACQALGDPPLLQQTYRASVDRWPEYQVHYNILRGRVDKLPPDLEQALLTRAKKTLKTGTEIEKGYAKVILDEAAANKPQDLSTNQAQDQAAQ